MGRFDPDTDSHPDIDLSPLGLGMVASRRHARIDYVDGSFVVADLGSRIGTFVNGERVSNESPQRLQKNDTITIGSVTFTYEPESQWPPGTSAAWDTDREPDGVTVAATATGALVGELPEALRAGHLTLHYQPQVELQSNRMTSVEALVRWMHPSKGPVPPGMFIPFAEDTGFIRQVTTFVMSMAAEQAAKWRRTHGGPSVSVNASVKDLEDTSFVERVTRAVTDAAGQPSDILIEVTESSVMSKPSEAGHTIRRLRDAGFRFGIDDFGAGESSLGYLANLEVDEVKLDRGFAMSFGDRNRKIVRGAIDMGHDLGLTVVCEGIEDEATATALRDLGCDKGQGWHFGRPVPPEELAPGS